MSAKSQQSFLRAGSDGKGTQVWPRVHPHLPPLPPLGCPSNCSSSGPSTSHLDPGHLWDCLLLPATVPFPPGSQREQCGHGTAVYSLERLQISGEPPTPPLSTRSGSVQSPLTLYSSALCTGWSCFQNHASHLCITRASLWPISCSDSIRCNK